MFQCQKHVKPRLKKETLVSGTPGKMKFLPWIIKRISLTQVRCLYSTLFLALLSLYRVSKTWCALSPFFDVDFNKWPKQTLELHCEASSSGFHYPELTGNGSMADRSPLRRRIKILSAIGGWRGRRNSREASGRMQKQDNSEEVREWRRYCLESVVADTTIGLGSWFECWDLCSLERVRACG